MELEAIPRNLLKVVLETVNETGNRLEANTTIIKDWIKYQPHLPSETYDDRILGIFLRGCKHNVERTKGKLDMYFTCRSIYPDLFQNRDPYSKSVKMATETFNVIPLPKPTDDGYRLTLHRFISTDASTFDPRAIFQTMFMIADIRLIEEPPIAGDIFLFDVANMTAGHFAKIVHPVLKYTLHCAQEAYPQRLKEIHLFNAPPLIDRVVTFFKRFLKEKMRNRFHIHSGHESIHKFVPMSHLPSEYGGTLKPLAEYQSVWVDKLKRYKEYFELQENVKSDERRRPENSSFKTNDLLRCEGAFRKLEID